MLLVLAGSLGLSGCGVRGNLESPPDIKNESNDANPGKPGEPEAKKGFVLDPLLR
jgi:predicted small lipoprotein YifL